MKISPYFYSSVIFWCIAVTLMTKFWLEVFNEGFTDRALFLLFAAAILSELEDIRGCVNSKINVEFKKP